MNSRLSTTEDTEDTEVRSLRGRISLRVLRVLCGGALPVVVALGVLASFADAAAATRNFFWKATSPRGTVYLVGSVHLLTKDYYPLNPALDAAFKESARLVEEVDMSEMLSSNAQMQLLMRGMLPAGQSIDALVSPATMTLVNKTAADLGLPAGPLKQFKPWMLALTLMGLEWQKAGFDADLGLDKHFYDRARAEGKPVDGLETVEYQIARFDEMTAEQQDLLLSESLKELSTEQANVTTLADAWKAGDVPTVERLVLEDLKTDPPLYERLLVERNRNWLPKIDTFLNGSGRPGTVFVVVGAAHLVGPDGLIQMLKARGYTVEQQ
jgi:uncharacterized protein YbaP (TraB family)